MERERASGWVWVCRRWPWGAIKPHPPRQFIVLGQGPCVSLLCWVCACYQSEYPSMLQTGGSYILVKGTESELSTDNLPVN